MRKVIVGDIHGCREEVLELLGSVRADWKKDMLIQMGDMVDRGPDPCGVLNVFREFKEEMGETFNSYFSALRISMSKAILLTTNASITEICDRCGFDDQSYFTKVFKKYTGVTPGRFRERRGRLETDKERGARPERR